MSARNTASHWKRYLSPRFLAGKLREKGVLGCLREAKERISRRAKRYADRLTCNRFGWVAPHLHLLVRSPLRSGKRLLSICDFRAIPYTVGEILWFQAFTMMLREERGVDKIDIIWLCDPENPARADQGITPENYQYHLSSLLPLAHINPHLGCFLLMDSPRVVETYVRENAHRYCHIEPRFVDYETQRRTYKEWYRRIVEFHAKRGFIPHLSCKPGMLL